MSLSERILGTLLALAFGILAGTVVGCFIIGAVVLARKVSGAIA